MRKAKNYLKKTQTALRNYTHIYQRKVKKKGSWACGCFLPTSTYQSIYFRKLPMLKENFHSTIGVFLKYMIILELGKMADLMNSLN